MSQPAVELDGVLREDGTLVLDARPPLPPGRVRVTVRPVDSPTDVMEVIRQIRSEQARSGQVPRSREEIDAEIAAMRAEDEVHLQGIERLQEDCQRGRDQGPS